LRRARERPRYRPATPSDRTRPDGGGGNHGLRREVWAKYEKAVACLVKDCDALLTFYDFPAEPLGRPSLPPYGTDHRLCR